MSHQSRKRRRLARRAIFPIVSVNGGMAYSPNRHVVIDLRMTDFRGGTITKVSNDRRRITVRLPHHSLDCRRSARAETSVHFPVCR